MGNLYFWIDTNVIYAFLACFTICFVARSLFNYQREN